MRRWSKLPNGITGQSDDDAAAGIAFAQPINGHGLLEAVVLQQGPSQQAGVQGATAVH